MPSFSMARLTDTTVRQSYLASKPIYEERAQIIKEIPGFWPAVFEEAPLEIESHVQARDLPILDHLTWLELNRFELDEDPSNGDPRSIQLTFRFSANEYFEDETLKKKFWYRRSNDGWSGLVSKPLDIQWKDGKDPTDGLLKSAVERHHKVRATEDNLRMQAKKNAPKSSTQPQGEEVSIFAWFGYHGRDISAQEYSRAARDEIERRETIVVGEEQEVSKAGNDGELIIEKTLAVDRDAEYPSCQETFPGGEELALAISEDLFPGALKYFCSHSTCPWQFRPR